MKNHITIIGAGLAGLAAGLELHRAGGPVALLGTAVTDPTNPQNAPRANELDQQTAADWLQSLELHPLAIKTFTARLRSEFLAEPEQFSLLDLARWGAFYYHTPGEEGDGLR
jgi:2-polyprenyl-6-methoxyphenol hydroxylase-like FAD-dependent oxidoreductase